MTENQVENTVIKWMRTRGWRATRNHVGVFKTRYGSTISIGTKGFPDWTFTRKSDKTGTVELIHWEAKATGKFPEPIQHQVMASLNHLGELSIWANSLEMFTAQYAQHFS